MGKLLVLLQLLLWLSAGIVLANEEPRNFAQECSDALKALRNDPNQDQSLYDSFFHKYFKGEGLNGRLAE